MEIAVTIEIANALNREVTVTIPAGTIFEAAPSALGAVQNVVTAQDYAYRLPPKSRRKVTVVGRCLNRVRSTPHLSPGKLTPFKYMGSFDQTYIWQAMSSPTGSIR